MLVSKNNPSDVTEYQTLPMNVCYDTRLTYSVLRFYSPVTLGRRPLLYYDPVYPKVNTEFNAVVSHINSPADFYIQLVRLNKYFQRPPQLCNLKRKKLAI